MVLGEAPAGELWWEHGAEGSLASCIVALDHIGQRAVALGLHEPCELVVDALFPWSQEGEGDLVAARGFAGDLGRALSRRGCIRRFRPRGVDGRARCAIHERSICRRSMCFPVFCFRVIGFDSEMSSAFCP